MNTQNSQIDFTIERTLTDAHIRMQDMMALKVELEASVPDELDLDFVGPQLIMSNMRNQLNRLTISERSIENIPLKYILSFRDTIIEILNVTEASVQGLKRAREYSSSTTKGILNMTRYQRTINNQIIRFDFALIQMEAMTKYRDQNTLSVLRRHVRITEHFVSYLSSVILSNKSKPNNE